MTDVDRRHAAINGDQMPLLAVSNSDNGTFPAPSACALSNPLSPATDSPNTPVSTLEVPDVKIDIDYTEQESDARNEPIPVKPIETAPKPDDASTVPQVGTPVDPGMCETSRELTTLILFQLRFPSIPPAVHRHRPQASYSRMFRCPRNHYRTGLIATVQTGTSQTGT